MKYYVYIHKRKDNNVVFYVGKGSGDRRYSKYNRSSDWHRVVSTCGGFYSEVLVENLEENDSLMTESFFIQNPPTDWQLTNKYVNSPLDYDLNWSERFYYDSTSPSGLRHTGNYKLEKGTVAGYQKFYSNGKPQEWTIRVGKNTYRAHRVIAALFSWDINDYVINHIDSNPHNNCINNLEVCTRLQNMQRTKNHTACLANSTLSDFGIMEELHKKVDNGILYETIYAKVRITLEGKRVSKRFSYEKFGKQLAWQCAREYRNMLLSKRG